ncbi:MAG TPA: MarR family winged helix-turn-helix transcriptional regulator [Nocardioides sp.]|nr:MarR family winged helix-turn-helix transcriptional regulator [Nocardioides sp.]
MSTPPAGPPATAPIGMTLDRVAKVASRAFDDALVAAGGSRPVWLILLALTINAEANQRQLAEFVGIQGATLTHHLNAMESAGLVTRARDANNRRSHVVRRTPAGDQLFHQLRGAAVAFDAQLRAGLSEKEIDTLTRLLTRLGANASGTS